MKHSGHKKSWFKFKNAFLTLQCDISFTEKLLGALSHEEFMDSEFFISRVRGVVVKSVYLILLRIITLLGQFFFLHHRGHVSNPTITPPLIVYDIRKFSIDKKIFIWQKSLSR